MGRHGGRRSNSVLVACLAVLIPAGAFAAASVDRGTAGGDRQVNAAGFAQEGIVAGPAPSRSPEPTMVTTTTPAPPPPPTTTARITPSTVAAVPRATTTTTRPPPTSPTWSVPPGAPPIPYTTIPGGSSWSNRAGELSVRMHIEPAAPVAGQPVTFVVDEVITQDPCCAVAIRFGDSAVSSNLTGGTCDSPTSLRGLRITHTYDAPGAYEAVLTTVTFPCGPITGDPPHRAIHGVGLHVCIVVGPGDAGAAGCPSAAPIYVLPPAGG